MSDLHTVHRDAVHYNTSRVTSCLGEWGRGLDGGSARDDLDELSGDDCLPRAVVGQRQPVNHVLCRMGRGTLTGTPCLCQQDSLAFLLAASMAVMRELCSEQAPSFMAW